MHQLCDANQGLEFLQIIVASRRKSVLSPMKALLSLPVKAHLTSPSAGSLFTCPGETFPAQVSLVILFIQLQWSSPDQPHSSATSLLVWRFLAAPTSQVHVSNFGEKAWDGKVTWM